ncbi:(R)-specific enoyl-CoA hydratase [uncultured Gammaproteobacteria bacterium]
MMDDVSQILKDFNGHYLEDMVIGMTAMTIKTITDADVLMYSAVSGDTNPVHLNQEYANGSAFQGRVAHGMLIAGLISTVLGTMLPGPGCIYVSQTLKFKVAVRVGDTVKARVTVMDIDPEKRQVSLRTVCSVGESVVLDGDAVVIAPRQI